MGFLKNIKRQKFYYYITNIFRYITPNFIFRFQLNKWLKVENDELKKRLEYYISPSVTSSTNKNEWTSLKDFKLPKKGSLYFFDLVKFTKYFSVKNKIKFKFGDVTENFDQPTIVKSRPINHNGNSVLMKLDSLRHFHFITDNKQFHEKNDMVVWRGEIHKENRRLLVEKFHNHSLCNIGEVSKNEHYPLAWKKEYLSINQQLDYKFILSIEGIDVATNLKWIMSSNSLCFMPTPIFETWYMEGKLIPNHHYVHIKDDYSDLLEKRDYYLNNVNEALNIIKNANDWVKQFENPTSEKQLSLLVLNNYFKQTS
ncbi:MULTISPECIES: glycosyl transferase family 90 [Tenacibaculum]|uniref:glycosyl transferase family 90 n=1 Tax=Tenacibaculum TaxID=104267 RepID=UPI000DE98143|nr:glycosyl transferase family 90 [Tenacibaculum sp. E3R01]RBW56386.1 lipopolysaccharide biosynthesis protein [Tenacibaculum sp. E3R01]